MNNKNIFKSSAFILSLILCFSLLIPAISEIAESIDTDNSEGGVPATVEELYAGTKNGEYTVSGYVIDEPTDRNMLGELSFTVVDDLSTPEKKLTVFAAKSQRDIARYDKVTVTGYLHKLGEKSLVLSSKRLSNSSASACSVTSVSSEPESLEIKASKAASDTLTVLQMTTWLKGKSAHYPISDEFIEKHQQKDGGYIELAESLGIPVDRQIHSPDQKWHFFESWFNECLKNGTISMEDDAKKDIYQRLLCPELLLWIFEACDVDPIKVKAAMNVAVDAKVNGTHIATMAKNMRGCVPWEDIVNNLSGEQIKATGVSLNKTSIKLNVSEKATLTASVTPLDSTDTPIWSIVDGKDIISITQSGNEAAVLGLMEGSAKIRVTYNASVFAEATVTVTDNRPATITGIPENIRLDIDQVFKLEPALSKGTGTFSYSSSNKNVAAVGENGVVTAVSYGEAAIDIICNENKAITSRVTVKVAKTSEISSGYSIVFDLGTRKTAKLFEEIDTLLASFVPTDDGIISSISQMEYIYGGANGGRGDTAWYTGDIIKFGTTNVNGSLTFELSSQVNYVKITGYVYDSACKLQVGNTEFTCTEMNEVSKETVEAGQASTVTIAFDSTDSLTIATTNKKPLFITSIEFGFTQE